MFPFFCNYTPTIFFLNPRFFSFLSFFLILFDTALGKSNLTFSIVFYFWLDCWNKKVPGVWRGIQWTGELELS